MDQNAFDRYLSANPRARQSLADLDRRAAKRMKEIEVEREAEQREADRLLEEGREIGRKLREEQLAADRARREAIEAEAERAEQARRDEIERGVRAAFVKAGGSPEQWVAERDAVMAEHRRREAVAGATAAADQDRAFWRQRAAAAVAGGLPGNGGAA